MTLKSTLERAAKLPRPALWTLTRYLSGGTPVDYPVSYDDFERDARWATLSMGRWRPTRLSLSVMAIIPRAWHQSPRFSYYGVW